MIKHTQTIALYTIIRREWLRMIRIAGQVFLPSVITMTLYFLIFGHLIGRRIGNIDGMPYPTYIAPGLIMMAVITNAYMNVSSSLFSTRFQKNIEELIVSPTPNWIILLGFVAGGVLRGLVIAILVTLITLFFIPLELTHIGITCLVVLLVAILFAQAGFTNALFARSFDDIAIVPTFVLTPLTYLGGVFYSINMLPPFWRGLSAANPILYMVNAFRYGMLGVSDISVVVAITMIVACTIAITALNLYCLYRGTGFKQ